MGHQSFSQDFLGRDKKYLRTPALERNKHFEFCKFVLSQANQELATIVYIQKAFDSDFPRWEKIKTWRFEIEEKLIEKHEKKMPQRRYYDPRLMLVGFEIVRIVNGKINITCRYNIA